MNNSKGLRLYIGIQEFSNNYYINTKGESYINKNTPIFRDLDSLLGHIKAKYKKRKAKIVAIDKDITPLDKEQILKFIKKNNLKISISNTLEAKIT